MQTRTNATTRCSQKPSATNGSRPKPASDPAYVDTAPDRSLVPVDQDVVLGDAVRGELRERITRAAGGNPLFISEMLAMAAGDADVAVPPTLRALMAARLDQLDEAERRILERGSVEGEIFHRGAVQAPTPEETQVTTRLAGLVRRELIRPERAPSSPATTATASVTC